jgi:hypothetical protein
MPPRAEQQHAALLAHLEHISRQLDDVRRHLTTSGEEGQPRGMVP